MLVFIKLQNNMYIATMLHKILLIASTNKKQKLNTDALIVEKQLVLRLEGV